MWKRKFMLKNFIKKRMKNIFYTRKSFLLILLLISPFLFAIDSSQWLVQKIQVEDGEDSAYYETTPDMTYQDINTNENIDAGGSSYLSITDGEILSLDGCFIQV